MTLVVSEIFDASAWRACPASTSRTSPITAAYGRGRAGDGRIAFDRPEVRNAFRPHTVDELYRALDHARMSPDVGLRAAHRQRALAEGRRRAFCSGGDQRIAAAPATSTPPGETADTVDAAQVAAHGGRLDILEVQRLIRTMPKVA